MGSSGAEVVKKVDKAIASVTKANDKKEDMMMMVAPYANWGEFIVPAPLSIALLGELILISADTDFSLEKKPPKDGFKVLRYPSSFRACLVQVSNAGWDAFNAAHTNMDQIRLHSGNVDNHVKKAVNFLIRGSNEEVKLMVPMALQNVQRIADECVSLVTSVENRFLFVMDLTAELLEACTNARGQYEEELKDTEADIKVTQVYKKKYEEEKENAKEQYERMKKQMEENQKMLKDAVASMPSGWDIIAMKTVEGITSVAVNALNAATFSYLESTKKREDSQSQRLSKTDEEQNFGKETPQQEANEKVYSKASTLVAQVDSLKFLLNDGKPNWEELKTEDSLRCVKRELDIGVEALQELVESSAKKKATELYETAQKVCSDLQDAANSFDQDSKEMPKLVERFLKLHKDVQEFNFQAMKATNANPMSTKGPQMSEVQPSGLGSSSAAQAAVQNAQIKIDTATKLIKNTQQQYDSSTKALKESNDKLGKVLADLAKFDMKKIDFEKIRETLIKGIKALAKLREQWGKMVHFFQMISNLIKCCLSTSLENFIEATKRGQTMALEGISLSGLMRDTIYEEAFQANKVAYVVQMISGTYVEISNQHLMDRITCLGNLVALDPKKDEHEIMVKRDELYRGCKDAQDAIGKLVMEKKRDFDEQVENRVAAIKNGLKDVLPARALDSCGEDQY